MKQTIIALLAAAAFVGQAAATINKGVAHYTDGHSDQAVWIDGEDACDYVYMGPSSSDLCAYNDGWFTAQNGFTYRFTGCGSSNFCLLNSDSSLNSCGHTVSYSHAGNGCHGSAGSFYVDQEWSFSG